MCRSSSRDVSAHLNEDLFHFVDTCLHVLHSLGNPVVTSYGPMILEIPYLALLAIVDSHTRT